MKSIRDYVVTVGPCARPLEVVSIYGPFTRDEAYAVVPKLDARLPPNSCAKALPLIPFIPNPKDI